MAADWIKIEDGLIDKPEVMQLSELLGIDQFAVVGHLIVFWCWVDRNMSPTCPQVPGTTKGLDRVAGRDGFSTALVEVGWLHIEDGKVSIPNYDLHLSNSAKTRAKEQRKKAEQRKVSRIVSPICPQQQGTKQGTREEKRREEKSITHTHTQNEIAAQYRVPEDLAASWERWCNYVEATTGRKPNPVTAETMLMELSRRGPEKAARDIEFSIRIGAKSIRDSDADYDKQHLSRQNGTMAQSKPRLKV